MAYDLSVDLQPNVSVQTRLASAQNLWQELSQSGMVTHAPCLGFLNTRSEEYYIDIPDHYQELIDVAQAEFPPKAGHCVAKGSGRHWWRFARL